MEDARGNDLEMTDGPCLWCREWVSSQRVLAGATGITDPAWATEGGDFGCDNSPETTEEAVGSHARPYDLAVLLMHDRRGEFETREFELRCARSD